MALAEHRTESSWGPRFIRRHDNGQIVGTIGFFGPPETTGTAAGSAEIGFGLVEAARDQGLATEALRAMLRYTDDAGIAVHATVEMTNAQSRRVLTKCGFTVAAHNRDGTLDLVRSPAPQTE